MFVTKSRLSADLDRWEATGLIGPTGAAAIRTELATRTAKTGLIAVFAVLGAVLLGCAGISFVAANWSETSKLLRLALLGFGLIASYGAAFELFRRKADLFAHAAVLAGIVWFGASIMLIAQMYHMDGDPPDAVWLWTVGALTAGLLLQSNPALGAAIVLSALWSAMVYWQGDKLVHWGFLPIWAVMAGGVAGTRWRSGMHALAITLSGWLMFACLWRNTDGGRDVLTAIGIGMALVAAFGGPWIDRWRRVSPTVLTHGILLAYAGLFMTQFLSRNLFGEGRPPLNLWAWGGATLALLCAAMAASWRLENPRVLRLTYGLFAIEILSLYISKIGTMLGTSAFFLVAGALLMAMAAIAHRLGLTSRQTPKGASA